MINLCMLIKLKSMCEEKKDKWVTRAFFMKINMICVKNKIKDEFVINTQEEWSGGGWGVWLA
jgi:hypothetical protein